MQLQMFTTTSIPEPMSEVKSTIRQLLDDHEYQRLAPRLERIERDRQIKESYVELRSNGTKQEDAMYELADRFNLSWETIRRILFDPTY